MTVNKIMIVEDDDGLQYYMKALIGKSYQDIEIVQAYDGQEALDYLESGEALPEVIFLDINMPGMNGFEFLEVWDKNDNSSLTRIAILTSSQKQEDKERASQYEDVVDYLVKPIQQQDLASVIEA